MIAASRVFVLLLVALAAGPAWAAQTLKGHLNGTFTGTATDGSEPVQDA